MSRLASRSNLDREHSGRTFLRGINKHTFVEERHDTSQQARIDYYYHCT